MAVEKEVLKLAIVGSHRLSPSQHETAEILVEGIIRYYVAQLCPGRVILVSGGAEEVDTIAKDCSEKILSTYPEIYLPEVPQWEPRGYKARNLKIAAACDVLWCLRDRGATTYGSGFTADQAEQRYNKEVHRLWL